MVEILKQPQFKPMNVIDQVMIIYAGTKGYLDKVPASRWRRGRSSSCSSCTEQRPEVRNALSKDRKLTPAVEDAAEGGHRSVRRRSSRLPPPPVCDKGTAPATGKQQQFR